MNDKWILAAQRAKTPSSRRKFIRLHKALKLTSEIAGCENCPLHVTRTNTVPFDNTSPVPLAFVGEAPGKNEDEQGKPFVGRSGKLLDEMIEKAGGERKGVVVLNTLACRPPKNRTPKPDELSACRPLFDKQLDFTGAWVVVLLGASALKQFHRGNITSLRGKPFWQQGRIFIPTFHPAYVLRKPSLREQAQLDINLAFGIINGNAWWEPKPVQQLERRGSDSRFLTELLDTKGWAVIDSPRIGDTVVVTRDREVLVPMKYATHVRYTVEEMVKIGELGRGAKLTTGELSTIHLVKTVLKGTVVA